MNTNKNEKTSMELDNSSAKPSLSDYKVREYLTFDDMELDENLLRGIYAYGYERPSSIQSKAIKPLSDGHDIIAQSQSGTGKTATFLLGSLTRVDRELKKPQVLVLAPNRELATQIYNVMEALSSYMKISGALIIGGTRVDDNFKTLGMSPVLCVYF